MGRSSASCLTTRASASRSTRSIRGTASLSAKVRVFVDALTEHLAPVRTEGAAPG